MKAIYPIALAAATAAFGAVQHAGASTQFNSGFEDCKNVSTGNTVITFSTAGAANGSSSAAVVGCPITWTGGGSTLYNATTRIYYVDSNSAQDFSCAPIVVNAVGSTLIGSTKYACATAGGCSTSGVSYTGTGYIDMAAIASTPTAYTIKCTIPAVSGASTSKVLGYNATAP